MYLFLILAKISEKALTLHQAMGFFRCKRSYKWNAVKGKKEV